MCALSLEQVDHMSDGASSQLVLSVVPNAWPSVTGHLVEEPILLYQQIWMIKLTSHSIFHHLRIIIIIILYVVQRRLIVGINTPNHLIEIKQMLFSMTVFSR